MECDVHHFWSRSLLDTTATRTAQKIVPPLTHLTHVLLFFFHHWRQGVPDLAVAARLVPHKSGIWLVRDPFVQVSFEREMFFFYKIELIPIKFLYNYEIPVFSHILLRWTNK